MYKVNYWDEDNNRINFYELSGHHAGECKVILKAKDIMYQVYERENPSQSFGCTSQYGTIWNDKLFIASKQAGDGGDPLPGGGRLVVARTMKCLYQSDLIDPSGNQCDGCGCLGIDEHKLYISTSNGVWIFDTDNYTVTGMVEGTANPNGSDGKPNTDPSGSLYYGQCGSMVRVGNRVFVAHQSEGLLVVDPPTDKVTDVLTMKPIYDLLPDPAIRIAWNGGFQPPHQSASRGTEVFNLRINPHRMERRFVTSALPCKVAQYFQRRFKTSVPCADSICSHSVMFLWN